MGVFVTCGRRSPRPCKRYLHKYWQPRSWQPRNRWDDSSRLRCTACTQSPASSSIEHSIRLSVCLWCWLSVYLYICQSVHSAISHPSMNSSFSSTAYPYMHSPLCPSVVKLSINLFVNPCNWLYPSVLHVFIMTSTQSFLRPSINPSTSTRPSINIHLFNHPIPIPSNPLTHFHLSLYWPCRRQWDHQVPEKRWNHSSHRG